MNLELLETTLGFGVVFFVVYSLISRLSIIRLPLRQSRVLLRKKSSIQALDSLRVRLIFLANTDKVHYLLFFFPSNLIIYYFLKVGAILT